MVPSGYDDMGAAHHFSPTEQEFEHDPVKRRFWLLRQALKSGSSMAEALKIAEQVEAFLTVGAAPRSSNDGQNKVPAAPLQTGRNRPSAMSQAALSSLLEPEKKAAITARLKAGDSNAQLAAEFGLLLVQLHERHTDVFVSRTPTPDERPVAGGPTRHLPAIPARRRASGRGSTRDGCTGTDRSRRSGTSGHQSHRSGPAEPTCSDPP